jgi:hypothetical protein
MSSACVRHAIQCHRRRRRKTRSGTSSGSIGSSLRAYQRMDDSELRTARRCERYAAERAADPHSNLVKRVVLQVWDLCGDMSASVAVGPWWQQYRPSTKCYARPITPELVAAWIAQRAHVAALRPASLAQGRHESLLAQRVVAEWRAAVWLLQQNNKGIAVPSRALLQQYVLGWQRPLITVEAEEHLLRIQTKRYSAKWLHFFRKRWDIRWKKLPARNPLPADDLRRKVQHNTRPYNSLCIEIGVAGHAFAEPVLGAK